MRCDKGGPIRLAWKTLLPHFSPTQVRHLTGGNGLYVSFRYRHEELEATLATTRRKLSESSAEVTELRASEAEAVVERNALRE